MQASLQLFTASSGNLSAKVAFGNNIVRHLHSTVKPEEEANLYSSLQWYGDLIVFAGIGLGWHIKNVLPKVPPHARCVVIDYFDDCIRHASETLFAGLGQNRTFFISAGDPVKTRNALSAFLKSVPSGLLQIVKHPASFDCFPEFYESLLDIIALECALHTPRHAQGKASVKKALLFFGNFFLEEEVRRALVACKIEPVLFDYKGMGPDCEPALLKTIQQEQPDFILSINMKGFDGNGNTGRTAQRLGVPLFVWFVDDPRPILLSNRSHVRPGMTALCWEREYCPLLTHAGFDRAEYLPLACDPVLFENTTRSSLSTNLGFVGTAMVDRFAGNIRDKFLWSDGLAPLVEFLSDMLCCEPAFPVYGSIPQQAARLGIPLGFSDERNLTWLAAFIIHHASMKKRKTIVKALVPQGIETFGDPEGWKELLGTAIVTHPSVDYRHTLASVYRRIAININITSCQMPTAVNQRVFDVPMAGSFVISDRQKDLATLFGPQEIAVYETIEDLQEKVGFYLENEAARRNITGLARKRILAEHTYAHRVQKIISLL
jgi:spore maturation protein CgeB